MPTQATMREPEPFLLLGLIGRARRAREEWDRERTMVAYERWQAAYHSAELMMRAECGVNLED